MCLNNRNKKLFFRKDFCVFKRQDFLYVIGAVFEDFPFSDVRVRVQNSQFWTKTIDLLDTLSAFNLGTNEWRYYGRKTIPDRKARMKFPYATAGARIEIHNESKKTEFVALKNIFWPLITINSTVSRSLPLLWTLPCP